MINRPDYKKLRSEVAAYFERNGPPHNAWVAITLTGIENMARVQWNIRSQQSDWPKAALSICKDLGLVNDGTGVESYTRPEWVEEIQAHVRKLREEAHALSIRQS